MALETQWLTISPVLFTSNGTQFGVVTVSDTVNFKDKQVVYIKSNTVPVKQFQIKRVLSNTQFIVGPVDNKVSPTDYSDISAYLVADGASIGAAEQDKLAKPSSQNQWFAVYESTPTNAVRTIPIDPYGNLIGPDNPLPVAFDGTISVGQVEIKGSPSGDLLNVNADGSINVNIVETPVTGQIVKNIYNEANSVASGSTTTIVQYTVPLGITISILYRISVSGENIAKYTVFYNGTLIDTRRTYYGSSLSEYFEFTTGTANGFSLNPGDTITVKVLHNRPYVGDFEGRIQVLEIS